MTTFPKKALTHPEWRATITERRTSSLCKDLRWRTNQQASGSRDEQIAGQEGCYEILDIFIFELE